MADWTNVVSAGVGVAGLAFGLYERYAGKRSLRVQKLDEVLRLREDKVLFKESVPDVALRPLAASVKEWRDQCSEAKAIASHGSSTRRDLQICWDAAATFENQVEVMLARLNHSDPYVFVSGEDLRHLDELKESLRETTREPAARLATRRRWWNL